MRKVLVVFAFLSTLLFASFGLAFADTYEIPVVANGKVITLTLTIEENQIVSLTTRTKGVLLGKAKKIEEESPIASGYWAQQLPNALDIVNVDNDKFSKNTFYSSKNADNIAGASRMFPYVGTDGKSVWLRLSAILISDDSILFDSCTILADDKKFDLKFSFNDTYHEYLSGSSYYDSADISLESAADMQMLEAVATAKSVQVRFYERGGYYDHDLTKVEKQAFVEMLAVYELLGGKLH